jgi:hypothetical protein
VTNRLCALPPHVYACSVDEGMIFLDIRRDRYVALGQRHMAALEPALHGHDSSGARPHSLADCELADSEQLIAALESQGLVTRDLAAGKAYNPVALATIDIPRSCEIPFRRPRIGCLDVARFTLACLKVLVFLRFRSFEWVVHELLRARSQAPTRHGRDEAAAQDVGARFQRISRFFFAPKDRCLFATLALAHFMRAYGWFPTFVMGIRSNPYRPHCWLQLDALAFDIAPQSLSRYKKILAI